MVDQANDGSALRVYAMKKPAHETDGIADMKMPASGFCRAKSTTLGIDVAAAIVQCVMPHSRVERCLLALLRSSSSRSTNLRRPEGNTLF
jgi:hypothetical protein